LKSAKDLERVVACLPLTNGFAYTFDCAGWAVQVPRCQFDKLLAALKEDGELDDKLGDHIDVMNAANDIEMDEDKDYDEYRPVEELKEARELLFKVAMDNKDNTGGNPEQPEMAFLALLLPYDLLGWILEEDNCFSPTFERAVQEVPEMILGSQELIDPMLGGFWHCYICRLLRHHDSNAKPVYDMSSCSDEKAIGCEDVCPDPQCQAMLDGTKQQIEAMQAAMSGQAPGIVLPPGVDMADALEEDDEDEDEDEDTSENPFHEN